MTAGRTVGDYRLLRVIGEGGMGVVHLGLDPADRAVAVKVVRPHVAADPETRARLAREVRSLLRVRHPRVAEVLDADFDAELPYVVMRYVAGEPLDALVRRDGPVAGALLGELAVGLAEAVAAVHAVGVVHRDLKPGNVLVVDGSPVLIDFGIARALDDVALTSTGLMVGTPGYLAPEVLDGHDVGTAADWWGWGAVVAFALTGRPPFRSGPLEAVWDRVRRGAVDLEGVPAPWARLLAATLRPDPADRPSPGQLVDAVADLTGRRPVLPAAAGASLASARSADTLTQPRPAPAAPARADTTRVLPRPVPSEPDSRARTRTARSDQAPTTPQPAFSQPASPQPASLQPPAWPQPTVSQPTVPQPTVSQPTAPQPTVPQPTLAHGPAPSASSPRRAPWAPVQQLPRRSALAVLGWLVVVAVGAVTPVGGAVLVLAWSGLARSVQWTRVAAAVAWARTGRLGAGARVTLTLGYPFRLLGALLASAGYLLLGTLVVSPLLLVGAAVLLRDVPWDSWTTVQAVLLQDPVPSGLVALAALLAWCGPGGAAVRQGSRALTEPVARHRTGRLVLAGLAGLVVVAAVVVVLSRP